MVSCSYSLSPGILKDWVYQVKNSIADFTKLKSQKPNFRKNNYYYDGFHAKHFQLYMTYNFFLSLDPSSLFIFPTIREGNKSCYLTSFLYAYVEVRTNWAEKLSAMPVLDMVLILSG